MQDFAHALPSSSIDEAKGRVATALNQIRSHAARPALPRRDLEDADQAACSMAEADKLGTAPVHQLGKRCTVLTYTSLDPQTLPAEVSHAIGSPNLHNFFFVGACYTRTNTYPTGAYWIVLTLN